METHLQRKIRHKANLSKHLKQLNYLYLKDIEEHDLLSIEKTDEFYNKLLAIKIAEENSLIIESHIYSKQLLDSIIKKIESYQYRFYLLCEYSNDSGLLLMDSLKLFNTSFNFTNLGYYRVTMLSEDFLNGMSLWDIDQAEDSSFNYYEITYHGDFLSQILLSITKGILPQGRKSS